ncbi:MAG: hypothetical protein JNN30_09620 [Rhodanobacteraceae bacterium]|nr:hypothetical protein [Rhodanobacteraceae bacterium]
MTRRLRILHLSGLHIGKEAADDHWRVERVMMGEAWAGNLREIAKHTAMDPVCSTGDLAQRGKPGTAVNGVVQGLSAAHQTTRMRLDGALYAGDRSLPQCWLPDRLPGKGV